MKSFLKTIFIFIWLVFASFVQAQNKTIAKALDTHKLKMDSLEAVLQQAKDDTTRINIYLQLCHECDEKDWLKYAEPLSNFIEKLLRTTRDIKLKKRLMRQQSESYKFFLLYYWDVDKSLPKTLEYITKRKRIFTVLHDTDEFFYSDILIASFYDSQGETMKRLKTLQEGYEQAKKMNAKRSMQRFLHQLTNLYIYVGDTVQALRYMQKEEELGEEIADSTQLPRGNFLMGRSYAGLGMYDKALPYYYKAAQLYEREKNMFRVAETYYKIGDVYFKKQLWDSALKNYERSILISRQLSSIYELSQMCFSMFNAGRVYAKTGNLKKALQIHEEALKMAEQSRYENVIADAYITIAEDYFAKKEFKKAKFYSDKALAIYSKGVVLSDIMPREKMAYQIDSASNDLASAFKHYYRYVQLKDKLNSEEVKKVSTQEKFQNDLEKQTIMNLAAQEKQDMVYKAEDKKQKIIIYAISVGLVLLLLALFLIFRNLKQKQKSNQELLLKNEVIAQQKHLVEEKHKEITDSINYAERIQRSFLASTDMLNKHLKEYFIFFQPKDVVSGDFYWVASDNETFYLVTADSTGHGVPGAIMSLLNITSLEKAVELHSEPAEILNHTRNTIIERLKKDGSAEGGKDGMDCSLIRFDLKNKQLTYAAANNPVWIVRDKQIIELEPDKMPVGKHDKDSVSFTQKNFDLQTGDVIYTLTDGLPDQFGGQKGKKFMYKQLKQFLIDNAHLSMSEQQNLLKTVLAAWMNNIEQVDDICVIGVRV